MVQILHPYVSTGKTVALTIWTIFSKVMSLLFNMLCRFIITILLRSKHHLLSWLQSLSTVILELKKIKSVTASIFSPSICHEVMGLDAMMLKFLNVEFQSTLFHPHQEILFPLHFLPSEWYHLHIWGWSPVNLFLFLPFLAILIPACDSSSLAFHMIDSTYKLNKQGDNIWPPCGIPSPVWNQSVVPCLVLTIASWLAYRFLRRQIWSSVIPISLRMVHSLWSTQSKALA